MSSILNHIRSDHMRHGIKVGLASMLAFALSDLMGMPYAYWAVITTVIVMQVYVADSIHMCLYRFTGTAIGACIGIIVILVFPPTPFFTLMGIFVGTGVCAYLTRFSAKFRMAAITLSIVYLTSLGDEHRIIFTLHRVLEIGIGVLCAFLVSLLVWPQRTGAALKGRIHEQYEELARKYMLLMGNFLSEQRKADPELFDTLAGDILKNKEMFHKVFSMERRFFQDDVQLLSLQVSVLRSVLERQQAMLFLLNEVEDQSYTIIMAPELWELTSATAEALRAIGAGTPHAFQRLEVATRAIEGRFVELRRQGVTSRFGAQRLFQVLGFINAAQHLGDYLLNVLKNQYEPNQPSV